MVWVIFDGGQRDGDLQQYGEELADRDYSVFDGPDRFAVYRRSVTGCTVLTRQGPAQDGRRRPE